MINKRFIPAFLIAGLLLILAAAVSGKIPYTQPTVAASYQEAETEAETEKIKETIPDPSLMMEVPSEDAEMLSEESEASAVEDASAAIGNIHTLSQSEIDAINSSYSSTILSYGGTEFWPYAAGKQQDLETKGISGARFLTGGGHVIALTFLEAWENGYTGQLLDLLNAYGVKAEFFITQSFASHHQDLVWRMINEGHIVGSHTGACPSEGIAYWSLDAIQNDAIQLQQYVYDTFGYSMTDYNFNACIYTYASAKLLSDMGYRLIMCSNCFSDYNAYVSIDANSKLAKLEAGMTDGSIYAFHVTNPAVLTIVSGLIQYAQENGYTIVTVQ